MKITKVYTRRGDKGQTSLVGGKRVSKSSVRLESYGTVDELSANIGMLIAQLPDGHEREMLFRIQNNLFNVCTNLATDQEDTPLYPSAHLPEGETELLEHEVDQIMKELPELSFPVELVKPLKLIFAEPFVVVPNVVSLPFQKSRLYRPKFMNISTD